MLEFHKYIPAITDATSLNPFWTATKAKAYILLDSSLNAGVIILSYIDYLMGGQTPPNPNNIKALNTRDITHVHVLNKHEFCEQCYFTEGFEQELEQELITQDQAYKDLNCPRFYQNLPRREYQYISGKGAGTETAT